jgi:hypothetical protein
MSDAIKEDKDGEYAKIIVATAGGTKHLDAHGNLAKTLIDDLREFKHEELQNLEEAVKNARPPTEDLFGIKRRFCLVCEQGCSGYLPNKVMVPQPGEFPTFCKNCKCPAHFHNITVEPQEIKFPEDLTETMQNFNISAKDLNFNCVVLGFQVRDLQMKSQNLNELLSILKEEGLEIISLDNRFLEIEEAIFLKSRMVHQTESRVMGALGLTLNHANAGKTSGNIIRTEGKHGSAFIGKSGANDPFLLNKTADVK